MLILPLMRLPKNILKELYPVRYAPRKDVINAFVAGAFVGTFLLVFQPFGLNRWQDPNKVLIMVGYGGVTTVGMLIIALLETVLFKRFFINDANWTVGRKIVLNLVHLLFIAVGNFLYSASVGTARFIPQHFFWFLLVTIAVGVFPITAFVVLDYISQLRKNVKEVQAFKKQTGAQWHDAEPPGAALQTPPVTANNATPNLAPEATNAPIAAPAPTDPEPVAAAVTASATESSTAHVLALTDENNRPQLNLDARLLYYVQANDNYVTLYYNEGGLANGHLAQQDNPQPPGLQKVLLRNSLSRIAAQLPTGTFMRCHRSYIVNIGLAENISGNAQGYRLLMAGHEVPVSRKYGPEVLQRLEQLLAPPQ